MVRLFVARAKTVQTKFNNRSSSTDEDNCGPVSYTHLTLPTILRV